MFPNKPLIKHSQTISVLQKRNPLPLQGTMPLGWMGSFKPAREIIGNEPLRQNDNTKYLPVKMLNLYHKRR